MVSFPSMITSGIVLFAQACSRKSLDTSTISFPLHFIVNLSFSGWSSSLVTVATCVASRLYVSMILITYASCSGSITIAILSCDSASAISVPSSHWYLSGTLSRSMVIPLVNSPIITDIPPAHPSLHLFIYLAIRGSHSAFIIFLSSTGFPLCTSVPAELSEF